MSKHEYIEKYYDHLMKQSKKLFPNDLAFDRVQDLVERILSDKFGYIGCYSNVKSINNYCWGVLLNMWRDESKKKQPVDIESIGEIESEFTFFNKDMFKTIYENELIVEGYTEDQVIKLTRIKSYIRQLKPHEKNLFDMYYVKGMSVRQISKQCSLPYSSCWINLNNLNIKLLKASKVPQKKLY